MGGDDRGMKTLWIFVLVVTLGFLAPLAQAAPVIEAPPARVEASGPPPADYRDPDRAAQPDSGADRHDWSDQARGHDDHAPVSTPTVTSVQDGSQPDASATTDDIVPNTTTCGDAVTEPHYTMDDLASAASQLDFSY